MVYVCVLRYSFDVVAGGVRSRRRPEAESAHQLTDADAAAVVVVVGGVVWSGG